MTGNIPMFTTSYCIDINQTVALRLIFLQYVVFRETYKLEHYLSLLNPVGLKCDSPAKRNMN